MTQLASRSATWARTRTRTLRPTRPTPARTPGRRRQRSVRASVAVSLLSVATAAVLAALPTQSPVLLSASSVLAVMLGWCALRITWTEVLQSRREHATDRAATASAYRRLFAHRSAEHAELTTAMTERLAEAQLSRRELEGDLELSQRRLAEAETRSRREGRRLAELQERVQVLELELVALATSQAQEQARLQAEQDQAQLVRRAEEADALAFWAAGTDSGSPGSPGSRGLAAEEAVPALAEWQEKVTRTTKRKKPAPRDRTA